MKIRDNLSLAPAAASQPPIRWAVWLIQRAARHAPQDLAPRLEEEWLADLSAHSGPLQQLRFALGCCWATQVIAHDPMVFGAAARGAVAGHGTLAAFSPEMGSPSSSRSTVIMLVLALHGAAVYALLTGLIHPPLVEAPPPPFQGSVIYAPIEPPVTPPGPKVSSTPWKAVAPIYVGPIYLPPLTGETSDAEKRPIQLASSQTRSVSRVLGGPGAGFPSTEIFYPAASIRLGETGAPAVRVCVDDRGRLSGDPTIADSSGIPRLDAGALALAKAGSGHYRSTTEDGKPVTSCYAFRVIFRLR